MSSVILFCLFIHFFSKMSFDKLWKTSVPSLALLSSSTTFLSTSFFIKQCIDIFGDSFNVTVVKNGIGWTNANYGGYGLTSTRVRLQVTVICKASEEGILDLSKSKC